MCLAPITTNKDLLPLWWNGMMIILYENKSIPQYYICRFHWCTDVPRRLSMKLEGSARLGCHTHQKSLGSARQIFKGCRICRRAPDINYFKRILRFHGFGMFYKLFWLISIQSCHLVGCKRTQTYWRDETDVMPQSGGWYFVANSIVSCLPNSCVCRKSGFQHFCQKLIFYDEFMGNRLGQNVRNDRGIISGFHKSDTLTCVLHVKVQVFSKVSISMLSVQRIDFFLEDRHVRRLFSLNVEYNPCSFFKTNVSHTFLRHSWIAIDFS